MDDAAVITLDVDWAPDFMVDHVADLLVDRAVHATWFVTHMSPAISRLGERPDLFELGIHPNFLKHSTHGDTPEDVLAHCNALVPGARSARTHSLVQSTPLLEAIAACGITVDCSLYLPRAPQVDVLEQVFTNSLLTRLPFVWEDDLEMARSDPGWEISSVLAGDGPRVFDFHPVHVWLNSAEMAPYEQLKRAAPQVTEVREVDAQPFRHDGLGAGTAFLALADRLAAAGGGRTVAEVVA